MCLPVQHVCTFFCALSAAFCTNYNMLSRGRRNARYRWTHHGVLVVLRRDGADFVGYLVLQNDDGADKWPKRTQGIAFVLLYLKWSSGGTDFVIILKNSPPSFGAQELDTPVFTNKRRHLIFGFSGGPHWKRIQPTRMANCIEVSTKSYTEIVKDPPWFRETWATNQARAMMADGAGGIEMTTDTAHTKEQNINVWPHA